MAVMRQVVAALCTSIGLAAATMASTAVAQDTYPSRAIRIVVPFAAGGGVDILTRILALHLSSSLGTTVIVDPRPGAGGNLGSDLVAKSPPDGYTLLMATTGTHTINPGLYSNLAFDPVKDFTPITTVASVPNLLVVNPTLAIQSVSELISLAKAQPGKLSSGSFGNGTSNHLSGELLKSLARIDIVHVPYKSAPQAVTDLIAGQLQLAFVNTPLGLPHVQAGKLRALAVTGAKRSAATPDYPTMAEAGVNEFVVESWYGLMAPAGTPKSVIERLQRETLAALAKPDVKDRFGQQGADIETNTPDEFAARIRSEAARWAEIIRLSGARID
jgi:tripartite-type tricarboxylate transporter receptor subunit TctC